MEFYKKWTCDTTNNNNKQNDRSNAKDCEHYSPNPSELYESETSFVGFKKDHPTKKEAYIYIKYKSNETNDVLVYTHFSNLITNLITLFKTIDDEFKI